jgi:RNA polymerase sigma-70 factor, ECF subfamily
MKGDSVNPGVETSSGTGSVSSSLLDRLRGRDQEAWRKMNTIFAPSVERWCREAGLKAEDALDVCQEVFHSAWRGFANFKRDEPGQSFTAWIRWLTKKRLADHRRRQQKQLHAAGGTSAQERFLNVPNTTDDNSDSTITPNERAELVQRALPYIRDSFTEKTWDAFWKVTIDGIPAKDVGAMLGMTAGAVFVAKSRVLKRLREEFQDLLGDGENIL